MVWATTGAAVRSALSTSAKVLGAEPTAAPAVTSLDHRVLLFQQLLRCGFLRCIAHWDYCVVQIQGQLEASRMQDSNTTDSLICLLYYQSLQQKVCLPQQIVACPRFLALPLHTVK